MSSRNNDVFCFDDFRLVLSKRELLRNGTQLPLSSKAFEVLAHLVSNPGRIVTKEEMLLAVWPQAVVEEGNLSQQVSVLRKALTDRSNYIVTIPGRGYQFTAKVRTAKSADEHLLAELSDTDRYKSAEPRPIPAYEPPSDQAMPEPVHRHGRQINAKWTTSATISVSLAFAIALGSAYWPVGHNQARLPTVVDYLQLTHDGREKFLAGTDGSRLYYTQKTPHEAKQVAVSGGIVAPVSLPDPHSWLGSVSPDGSTILVITEAGGMTSGNSVWSLGLLGSPLRRLVEAVASTWSPDGQTVAYATQLGDICLIRSDGTLAHKLTRVGGYVSSISWSPDGSEIRFVKSGRLWEISPDGTNLHQLLGEWRSKSSMSDGSFAPDGRFFFVSDGQIWVIDEPSVSSRSTPIRLTSGPVQWHEPTPSKDAKEVFAVGTTRRGELVIHDAKSSRFIPYLGGISAEFVSFSKDGRSVAYVSYPEGVLWKANRDGSGAIQLTSPPTYPKQIRWSPDGNQILFVDQTSEGKSKIYMVPSMGGALPKPLLPQDTDPENDPTWSPDGTEIAFSTSPEQFLDPRPVVRIVNVVTHQVTTVADSYGLYSPRWSPSGRFIVAATLDSLSMRVYDLSTQRWTTLSSGPVTFPEWSNDSRFVYYVSWGARPAVLRIGAVGNKIERVCDLTGEQYTGFYSVWMGLDPENAPIMLYDRGSHDIYALTLNAR